MSTKNDKWVMFRNYMHNELGITKDDIREWIKESIHDEVKNVVNQAYGKCNIEAAIKKEITQHEWFSGNGPSNKLINKAAQLLIEKLEISIKK